MNVRSTDVSEAYALASMKRAQDEEKAQGEAAVRLIETARQQPQKPESRPPGPNSTVSVVA